jgi:DNA end-binding protein Ku
MAPVWHGRIELGDLSLGVRLLSGPAPETISLTQIHVGCGSPIGQRLVCKAEGRAIERSETVRARVLPDGRYVALPEDLLRAAAPPRRATLPLAIIAAHSVDPIYYESAYYVHPEADEAAYVALHQALRQADLVALTKIVLQRERWMIIRPAAGHLVAHTLYYASETRHLAAFRQAVVPSAELRAAWGSAVASRVSVFDPRATVDEASERLRALIDQARSKETAASRRTSEKGRLKMLNRK